MAEQGGGFGGAAIIVALALALGKERNSRSAEGGEKEGGSGEPKHGAVGL